MLIRPPFTMVIRSLPLQWADRVVRPQSRLKLLEGVGLRSLTYSQNDFFTTVRLACAAPTAMAAPSMPSMRPVDFFLFH